MSEKALELLKKRKAEREKKYTKLKGMVQGARLTKLTQANENLLILFEYITDNIKSIQDNLDSILEIVVGHNQRIIDIEEEIRQLKETMDTLNENR
jgi:wobble nucleotide-excising tRNase